MVRVFKNNKTKDHYVLKAEHVYNACNSNRNSEEVYVLYEGLKDSQLYVRPKKEFESKFTEI